MEIRTVKGTGTPHHQVTAAVAHVDLEVGPIYASGEALVSDLGSHRIGCSGFCPHFLAGVNLRTHRDPSVALLHLLISQTYGQVCMSGRSTNETSVRKAVGCEVRTNG